MAKRKAKSNRKSKVSVGSTKLAGQELRGEVREEVPISSQDISSGRSDSSGGGEVNNTRTREGSVANSVQHVSPSTPTGTPPNLNYQTVESLEDLQECATWLVDLGNEIEKTIVGIAVYRDEIAFATSGMTWTIPTSIYALREVLKKVLVLEKAAPVFISRDAREDISRLAELLDLSNQETQILAKNFVHDMRALEYTTGYPILTRGKSLSITNDALDAATVGPMMATEPRAFYTQVSMPLVRYVSSLAYGSDETVENFNRWTVIYEHLLFRILAHYTQDPTIITWLQNNENPMEKFAELVELENPQALAFLLWMCCGEDMSILVQAHPQESAFMPESPQLIKATQIDKKIPTLRLGLIGLIEQFTNSKKAHTLYGRQSPWSASREGLLHFVLFGSITDILDIVMVSLLNLGSNSHFLVKDPESKYTNFSRATIIGYTDQPAIEWQNQLEQLTPLNNPLHQVSLNPKASVE